MSLLSKVANQEVFDFLRTVTIKSTYFADKFRDMQILPSIKEFVPEISNPYVIHLAGEYIIDPTDKENYPSLESYKRALASNGGTWYRLTKDTTFNMRKNYFVKQIVGPTAYRRLTQDAALSYAEDGVSPTELGLYEYQPLVIDGIINPITGESSTLEYRCSQQIYDREGVAYPELRNTDLYRTEAFDRMMYITSLDTGQLIPFTLENLYVDCALAAGLPETSVHSKTLEAYKIPGRYFDLLCERYPTQVDLIKAIVYRVPSQEISSIITAKEMRTMLNNLRKQGKVTDAFLNNLEYRFKSNYDMVKLFGQDLDGLMASDSLTLSERRRTRIAKAGNLELLHADTERLDDNEKLSLKAHMIEVLHLIANRWAIKEYSFEANYAAVLWTMVWSVLPVALIAKRYANVKTPAVSMSHMWDYLESCGLAKYKGYLNEKQSSFLYKNMKYLLDHAGQQRALNVLIDNILSEYGLALKSKTVVLDTTNSLSEGSKPTIAENQCLTCSRRNVTCFKNIKNFLCDDWLGTMSLCKAEPVVLTEEFAGATKNKIIKELIASFGYTQEAAEFKYRRSFIWRDDDVEAIKNDLDRHQIVDQSGRTTSLSDVISTEHDSGLEPIFNEDVVAAQTEELRTMRGTYTPTKLLELSKSSYNARFADVFNRFLTESMFRLAPKIGEDGKLNNKVVFSYKFNTTEGASEYIFSFGEMLAAVYLAFVRENKVDTLLDEIEKESATSDRPKYETATDGNGNPIVIGTDIAGNPVYLKKLASWVQHRLTDMMNEVNYDFAIPTKCRTTTALKFGKPVLQEELVDVWTRVTSKENITGMFIPGSEVVYDDNELFKVTNATDINGVRILIIRGTRYAVEVDDNPDAELWENFDTKLKILGSFTTTRINESEVSYQYHENNDEIPLIPKYFRWYYAHLNPSSTATAEEKELMKENLSIITKPQNGEYVEAPVHAYADNDRNEGFSKSAGIYQVQSDVRFIDQSKKDTYGLFEVKKYVNVDALLAKWVDVTGIISEQSTLAMYIDNMFSILESLYCIASSSGSVRAHLACKKFLDCVLARKEVRFDLTTMPKTHTVEDGTKVAYYSDWINQSKELAASFKIIENLSKNSIGWNELGTKIVNEFLKGCNIEYAQAVIDDNQFNKIKELVLQLSSYKINIVDDTTSAVTCQTTTPIVEDNVIEGISSEDHQFFDPIGEGNGLPKVGNLITNLIGNDVMVPTIDLRVQEGKEYFILATEAANRPSGQAYLINPATEPFGEATDLPKGRTIQVGQEFSSVPKYEKWVPYVPTKDEYVLVGKEYHFIVPETQEYALMDDPDRQVDHVLKSEVEDVPEDALIGTDTDGQEIIYKADKCFEMYHVGDKLPFSELYEKINIYNLLGIRAVNGEYAPLAIGRDPATGRWFYMTGRKMGTTIEYPASLADKNDPRFVESEDKFDLDNDFSNEHSASLFGSATYRLNIPTTKVKWNEPIFSLKLEKVLAPTVASVIILRESKEPSILLLVKDEEGNEGSDLDPKERAYRPLPS